MLIVEILNAARWRGLFAMFDLSNFEQSWPWWWTKLDGPRSWESRMFQIPAYDPVAIVMMGFGVVLAAGFAFVL